MIYPATDLWSKLRGLFTVYSLESKLHTSRGLHRGLCSGILYYRGFKGDTRGLDYGSDDLANESSF